MNISSIVILFMTTITQRANTILHVHVYESRDYYGYEERVRLMIIITVKKV